MTQAANRPRINTRMAVLFGIVALAVGWVVYTVVHEAVTGGMVKTAQGVQVDLKAMSNFQMDQDNATLEDIPKRWRDLDGQRVILVGQMWSPLEAGGKLRHFMLCYSIAKCCFQGPRQAQHFVSSMVLPDAKLRLRGDEEFVRVTGKLHVRVLKEAGHVTSIYQVDVERVDGV